MDWQSLVKTVAPWLGTALGGPLGGMAVSAIADAIGVSEKTADAVKQALSGVTPDQMLALKKADQDFAVQMKALNFKQITDLETIAAGDRDSARRREETLKDHMPAILAVIVIVLAAVGEGSLLLGFEPRVAPELVGRILGTLDTATVLVLTYFFGSTASSSRKTELIAQSQPV